VKLNRLFPSDPEYPALQAQMDMFDEAVRTIGELAAR